MSEKLKPEIMWAIYGTHGFYTDTALTRKEMIAKHCAMLGVTWEYCKRRGDRAVKVIIKAWDRRENDRTD